MRASMPRLIALGLVWMLGFACHQSAVKATAQEVAAIVPPQGASEGLSRPLSSRTSRGEALLAAIAAWLSENFQLPATKELPAIVLVPQARMLALRHRETVSNEEPGGSPAASGEESGSIVGLYDALRRTIYLTEGWHGDTPVEVSVLVHEMVHFLEDVGRQTFECPQAQERLAYAAQERWLALSGHSLEKDFEVDAFTLLVRSSCLY